MNAMQKGKAIKLLNEKINYNGQITSYQELIDQGKLTRPHEARDKKGRALYVMDSGPDTRLDIPKTIYNYLLMKDPCSECKRREYWTGCLQCESLSSKHAEEIENDQREKNFGIFRQRSTL